ncbi:hypothetical protein OIN60_21945 [Paenibacillus sp. P96]|uniref:Uncharacterized protein n=1 Tax=Paenibacillus zeirhizosphaerae TaxID=2987519 RepID=A0ABT9FXC5_9BACL|nr:hypothetical protein [Paenibacillus sp. P96]MDP4099383.1 hypothetical protein [Paenibacillus sp. P96]
MGKDKEEKDMVSPHQKTAPASNGDVLKLAKQGMKKYRKTLDKLAKN